jgi:signal transduction histidine kinase/DNA-binding response OmpR family regulator/ligand-binding sensor domain-containing protein
MRVLYFLFLLLPGVLLAQPNGWQELTISDGLSQGMIFDLKQDPNGFIWVATKDGLNRFDGYNFKVFTHDPYNEYSLSDNNCSTMLVDSRGRLWVGTLNQGLNLFDTRTQRFYHLDIRDQASSNAGNYAINWLFEDPQGAIWVIAEETKLIKISLASSLKNSFPNHANFADQVQLTQIPIDEKKTGGIGHISFRPDGQAVLVCNTGLLSFNWQYPQKGSTFTLFTDEFLGAYTVYTTINQDALFGLKDNKILYRQHGRLKTIYLPKNEGAVIREINPKKMSIAQSGLLWLISPDDLMKLDSLTARNAFTALPGNLYAITTLLEDQTGNIWLGTSGYGLRKFNPKIKQFHSLLPAKTLSYLYVDQKGRVYVRHEFAYEQLDWANNRTHSFLPDGLPPVDKRQRYMMQDRRGTFWVSNTNFQTHEMYLFKFSADWQLLKKYPLPPNTSFGFYNNQTVEDKFGKLWIGAINGKLLQFDPQTEKFQIFSYQSLLPQKGAEIETYTLYFDQDGTLWIGTQQGLIRTDHPQTRPVFSLYKNSQTNRQSLSNDFVLSLLNDPNQPTRYLWVGTKGNGLDRLDKQTGSVDHITEKQGLPNKVVYGILADEFRNLWLSTNRGLAQFNPKTNQFRNFTKADGLQDDEFNTGSFFKSQSGELMFGGIHGLTTFRAADMVRASGPATRAHLIGLKVNNETVDVGSSDGILTEGIEYMQQLDLSHTQNLITFEFGLMDFANSAKNQYRYRLNGIDRDWVSAGTNRFANYAQLPPGNYAFRMMGSVDGEVWSKPIELQVRIHPPFYQTWWAYLLYAIIIAVVGWQLYRVQTQRLLLEQQVVFEKKEANRLAELDSLKTEFFTNISHEFRTPLTLILGPLDNLKKQFPHHPELTLMERNGHRLMTLINQLLDLGKLEAGELKPELEPGDIAAFFRMIAGSFNSLAESRGIAFSFDQNQATWWARFDRDKLEKIVTNLLSNAFKFTPAGNNVRMKLHYPDEGAGNQLLVTIQDTGIGIPPEHVPNIFNRFYQVDGKLNRTYEGTGIGLALVNELVRVLNGTIDVVSTEGLGTTFTVALPLMTIDRMPTSWTELSLSAPVASISVPAGTGNLDSSAPGTANILLIIDDNEDIRSYVRSIFEQDYQIIEAIDGQDGLEKATTTLPDVVICDLMMPRLDGFGFCEALKMQLATSHIPVIMLTAKATVEDRIAGFELGADDYLTKPFNRSEIQVRVRNLIEQRERLYQWFSMSQPIPDSQISIPAPLTAEQQFIDRLTALVIRHIDDTGFTVEELAEAANLSRVQLHRKLKALTNKPATSFIRDIRLARAAELLTEGQQNVTQVAYSVGFDNLSYFAKVFQERYGVLPSQYGKPTSTLG